MGATWPSQGVHQIQTRPSLQGCQESVQGPKWAIVGAYFMVIFEFFFMIPGLLYYVYVGMGFGYCIIGLMATFLYVPCWIFIQWWNTQAHPDITSVVRFERENNPIPKLIGSLAIVGSALLIVGFLGTWIGPFSGLDLISADWTDGYEAYIPAMMLVLGMAIMVLEIINFLKPRESSKPISIAALMLSLTTLVLGILFFTWNPMNGLMGVESGAYIGLFGGAICTLFTIAQILGINGLLPDFRNTTATD